MDAANKLLDKAVKACSPATARALSEYLGVTESAVSNWRRGKAHPDAVSCERIARLLDLPLAHVLGVVGEARAISSAEKAVWRRLASAACLVLALAQAPAHAATSAARTGHGELRIMYRRVIAALRQIRIGGALRATA